MIYANFFSFFFLFKVHFDQNFVSFRWDKLNYPRSIVYLSCYDIMLPKSLDQFLLLPAHIYFLQQWRPRYVDWLQLWSIKCAQVIFGRLWELFATKTKSKHTISGFYSLIGEGLMGGVRPTFTNFLNSNPVQDTRNGYTNVIKIISGVFDQNFSDELKVVSVTPQKEGVKPQ